MKTNLYDLSALFWGPLKAEASLCRRLLDLVRLHTLYVVVYMVGAIMPVQGYINVLRLPPK